MMKAAILGFALLVSGGEMAMATVLELEDATAKQVMDVYEEMREEEVVPSSDNGWIHDFEQDHMGSEMDHLTRVKRAVVAQEEM
jgi:hypothetical protein